TNTRELVLRTECENAGERFRRRTVAQLRQQSNGGSTARLVEPRKRGFHVFTIDGGLSVPEQAEQLVVRRLRVLVNGRERMSGVIEDQTTRFFWKANLGPLFKRFHQLTAVGGVGRLQAVERFHDGGEGRLLGVGGHPGIMGRVAAVAALSGSAPRELQIQRVARPRNQSKIRKKASFVSWPFLFAPGCSPSVSVCLGHLEHQLLGLGLDRKS